MSNATSWTDKTGRTLTVMPAEGDKPARLVIALPGIAHHPAAVFLDGETDLAEIAVAMHAANGKPAPVITPRPDVDTSEPVNFRGFRLVAVDLGRQVRIETGDACEVMPPHAVRQFAGLLVAFADAAEAAAEPDPADVERLAVLVTGASRMAPEDAARYLLRHGVSIDQVNLPGEGNGNG